jgi:dTDP-glucose 4,6-dehydratase
MRALVTGGAGFIGSALVRRLVGAGHEVLNVDNLTYAGRLETVAEVSSRENYRFSRLDIADRAPLGRAFAAADPDVVFHLAAESHVDRSIEDSGVFIRTNLVGTHTVLECALDHWKALSPARRAAFRVVHVSTDEVYGTLADDGYFTEQSRYAPNSPYSASKASADHLARAWHATYGLPVVVTNCSNNYGPWQHPEKLIPTILRNALAGEPIPIYGTGTNVRDWLFVEDHVDGLIAAASHGMPGQQYNFGGGAELANLEVARAVCKVLDTQARRAGGSHADAISFVTDRPGHDHRYAIDAGKAKRELGWSPAHGFEEGLESTIRWFLANRAWFERSAPELARRGISKVR